MALNALQSNMVRFTGTPGITVGDATIGYRPEYTFRTSTEQKYNALVQNKTDIALQGQYYIQLGEELYDGKLTKRFARDDFERPGYNWQFDGKDIGTYVDYTLKRAEYTEGVSGETLYDLLTYTTINENDLLRYVDGEKVALAKSRLARSVKSDVDAGVGNGVLTEVFVDDLRDEVTITSISTWLAKANSDYNTSTETLSLKVYYTDRAGRTFTVDGEDVPAAENVKKDDFVLVNISLKESVTNPEVVKIGTPEILTDSSVTKWSRSDTRVVDKLTTGGTEYKSSEKAFYDRGNVFDDYDNQLLTDNTYNVYVDKYGYAVGVDLYEGTKNYVFITGYDRGTSHISIKTADAAAIFLDGTMEVITVNVTDTNKNIDRLDNIMDNNTSGNPYFTMWNNAGKVAENRWYTYTVANNGTYTLRPATRMFATDRISPFSATQILDSANLYVEDNGTTTWNGATPITAASTRAYGEDASIYITVDTGRVDLSDPDTSYKDAITDVNGVYTGAQDIKMELTADTQNQVPNAVYTLYDSDNYIIASIVLGEAQGATTNYAYILGNAKSERIERESSTRASGDVTYYWEFDAVLNGEKQTLTAKTKYPSATMLSPYTVQELRFDGEYVSDVKGVAPSKFHTSNETNTNIENRDVYDVGHVAGTAWVNNTTGIMDPTSDTLVGGNGAQSGRIDDTLDLQGRTLKTKDGSEVGLALARDAKAVVVQREDDDRVVTNCASVADAIARLADRDRDDAGVQFKGRIVAVLDDRGIAQWVVFVSDTQLVTGSNPNYGQNTQSGGVTYQTANWNGFPYVNVSYTYPEYVDENTANVTIVYGIYANGVQVASSTFSITADGTKTHTTSWSGVTNNVYVGADATVTVQTISVMPASTKVRLLDQSGKALAGGMLVNTAGGTVTSRSLTTAAAGEYLGWVLSHPDTTTTLPWTISGITSGAAAVTGAASGTIKGDGSGTTSQGIYRSAGTGYVDIIVNTNSQGKYMTLTGSAAKALGGASGWVTDYAGFGKDLTVSISIDTDGTASKTVASGTAANIFLKISAAPETTDGYGLRVTLSDGTKYLFVNDGTTGETAVKVKEYAANQLTSDTTFTITKVEAVAVPKITGVTFTDANGNGQIEANDTITVTFDRAVTYDNSKISATTIVLDDNYPDTGDKGQLSADGKSLTVKVATAGDGAITFVAGAFKDSENLQAVQWKVNVECNPAGCTLSH